MIKVAAERLLNFCEALLRASDVPAGDAAIIAGCLLEANLRGTDSHGVLRLPIYIPRFQSRATNPQPDIITVNERGQAALLDGDNGLGHVVAVRAMDKAIDLARNGGLGFCVARNSNHFGAASYFALRAAEAGMV